MKSINYIYFTLDAGPNVHIIAPYFETNNLEEFSKDILSNLTNVEVFKDCIGKGLLIDNVEVF